MVVTWQEVRWIWQMRQKHCSPIRSTFKVLVVQLSWWRIGPSVDQWWLQALQFSGYLIDLLNILLRYNGFSGIQKAVVDQTGSKSPNNDHDLFWCSLALGSAFELLVSPSTELTSHRHFLYKIHFFGTSQSQRILCSLLHRVREDDISKWQFFRFSVSSWAIHLSSFFTFPICFKCHMTIEWLMLSSSATSHVVVRGSASMILSIGRTQLPMTVHCASHLEGSHLLCKTFWTTTALYFP